MEIGTKVRKTSFTAADRDLDRIGTIKAIDETYATVKWNNRQTVRIPLVLLEKVSS